MSEYFEPGDRVVVKMFSKVMPGVVVEWPIDSPRTIGATYVNVKLDGYEIGWPVYRADVTREDDCSCVYGVQRQGR
jgi:hypothetical protein